MSSRGGRFSPHDGPLPAPWARPEPSRSDPSNLKTLRLERPFLVWPFRHTCCRYVGTCPQAPPIRDLPSVDFFALFHRLRFRLCGAFRDRFVEKLLHLTRGLLRQFRLLVAQFALLVAELALLFSQCAHLLAQLRLPLAGLGLELADLALQVSDFRLNVADLLHRGAGAELPQFGFEFVEVHRHVRNIDANLFHLCAQLFLLFAQSFLFLAEFLLRGPELAGAINRGLVANDVGFFVPFEPEEVAGDRFLEFLNVLGIFGRAGQGEGIGFAGGDDEALTVVVAVGIGEAAAMRRVRSSRLASQNSERRRRRHRRDRSYRPYCRKGVRASRSDRCYWCHSRRRRHAGDSSSNGSGDRSNDCMRRRRGFGLGRRFGRRNHFGCWRRGRRRRGAWLGLGLGRGTRRRWRRLVLREVYILQLRVGVGRARGGCEINYRNCERNGCNHNRFLEARFFEAHGDGSFPGENSFYSFFCLTCLSHRYALPPHAPRRGLQ